MASTRMPLGVLIVAILAIIFAVYLIYAGFVAAVVGTMLESYGSYHGILALMGKMYRLFGALFMILGGVSIYVSIGLLMMNDNARHNGVWVFWGIAALSFIMGMIIAFFTIYGSIPFLIVAGLFGFFAFYLRMPATRKAFDAYGYEAPTHLAAMRAARTEIREPGQVIMRVPEPEGVKKGVTVPENMKLCPNCDIMNPKANDVCRMCGTVFED